MMIFMKTSTTIHDLELVIVNTLMFELMSQKVNYRYFVNH